MNSNAAIGRTSLGRPTPPPPRLRPVSAPASPDRVRALFDSELAKLIARRADVFDAMRGTLSLFVEGAGSWTIQFGDHTSAHALAPTATFEGDCIAVFSVAGFLALIDGRTDGQAPVVIGESRLLSRLGQLMVEPARGPLGARLQSATSRR